MKIQLFLPVLLVALILGGVFLFFALNGQETEYSPPKRTMEKISFLVDKTETIEGENWLKIVGNYWAGRENKAVILLHMMPATKESWNELADKLNESGFHVLAIDLRGHGESVEYKIDDIGGIQKFSYKDFSDKQHQNSIHDIEGARNWLVGKGISPENIYIGGASIGANLSLQYLAQHEEAPAAFLLSPGLDYRGVKTDEFMTRTRADQRIFLVAAKDDKYSAETIEELNKIGRASKQMRLYDSGGHGTNMLKEHPELMDEVVVYLDVSTK